MENEDKFGLLSRMDDIRFDRQGRDFKPLLHSIQDILMEDLLSTLLG